jgi:hypothetical protein
MVTTTVGSEFPPAMAMESPDAGPFESVSQGQGQGLRLGLRPSALDEGQSSEEWLAEHFLRAADEVDAHLEERGYMEDLICDYERGAIEPLTMNLPLGEDAPPALRQVADDLEFLFGLRAAVDDHRPMPYACRWRTEQVGLGYRTIQRCLAALAERGAIVTCESTSRTNEYKPGGAR